MNAECLLDAIGGMDERLLERSEEAPRRKWPGFAAAACAAVALLGALIWKPPTESVQPEPTEPFVFNPNTSDRFADLDALLAHLSKYETHNGEKYRGGSVDVTARNGTVSSPMAIYGNYAYYRGNNKVHIAQTTALDLGSVGTLDTVGLSQRFDYAFTDHYNSADRIFVLKQTLIVVLEDFMPDSEEYQSLVRVQLYDLADPLKPVLQREFCLYGNLADAILEGDTLVLLTSDGACACGWGGGKEYHPNLCVDGVLQDWPNEQISILGEPTKLEYASVALINCASGEVADKHAFYGNIEKVFFDSDWIALQIGEAEAYTFRLAQDITYTGKLASDQIQQILSITATQDRFRLMAKDRSGSLLALEAQPTTGFSESCAFPFDQWEAFQALEILWEENRAIVITTSWTSDHEKIYSLPFQCALTVADFSGEKIRFPEQPLSLELSTRLLHGNAHQRKYLLGDVHLLIPVDTDLYALYSNHPGRLDLLDLSDSAAPRFLREDAITLPHQQTFGDGWEAYGSGVIGIQSGDRWLIYGIEPEAEEPFRLLDFCQVENDYSLDSDRYTAVADGYLYLTAFRLEQVYRLSW